MPATSSCTPCCGTETQTTDIPGSSGANAFTVTTASFVIPAIAATVVVAVADTSWMVKGQPVFASDGTDWGTFEVNTINSGISVTLEFLGAEGDGAPGATINSGAGVSPGGAPQAALTTTQLKALNATLLAGIAAFTDSTGGVASNTLEAGVGIHDWFFYVSLPDITAADLIGAFTPGYAFRVLKVDFLHEKAVTTGAKAATLTPKINGSAITGGVLALSGTYAAGAVTAGSTVTAANNGTSAQTFSITASAVTTFVEGNGIIRVRVQNFDTVNAVASLSAKVNSIRSQLQT